jgi:hypothetical protein
MALPSRVQIGDGEGEVEKYHEFGSMGDGQGRRNRHTHSALPTEEKERGTAAGKWALRNLLFQISKPWFLILGSGKNS